MTLTKPTTVDLFWRMVMVALNVAEELQRPLIPDIIVHEQVVVVVLKQEQNPCSPHTQFFELNLVLI